MRGSALCRSWRSQHYCVAMRMPPPSALTAEQQHWLADLAVDSERPVSLDKVSTVLDMLKVEQRANAVWRENLHAVRALRLLMQYGGWIVPRFAFKDGRNEGGLLLVGVPSLDNQLALRVFPDPGDFEQFAQQCERNNPAVNYIASPITSGLDLVERIHKRNASKTARHVQYLLFGRPLGLIFGMSASGYGLEMLEEAALAASLVVHKGTHPVQNGLYWTIKDRSPLEVYCCRAAAMQYAREDEYVVPVEATHLENDKKVRFIC